MGQKKPKLVRVIGVIELILTTLFIIALLIFIYNDGALLIFLLVSLNRGLLLFFTLNISNSFSYLFIKIISGLISLFSLISAIALIRFKPLGRKMIIILAVIIIGINIAHLFNSFFIDDKMYSLVGESRSYVLGIPFFNLFNLIPIVYYVAIIFYFMTSEVKAAFQENNLNQ